MINTNIKQTNIDEKLRNRQNRSIIYMTSLQNMGLVLDSEYIWSRTINHAITKQTNNQKWNN